MPRSDDAEAGVLSCFLQNPEELLDDALASMEPGWFYHVGKRLLYEELLAFHAQPGRKALDLVTLSQHLLDREVMEKIGGAATLAELYNFVPTVAHYPYYKGILRDKFHLRCWIAAHTENIQRCYELSESPDVLTLVSEGEARVFDVLQKVQGAQSGTHGNMLTAEQFALGWMDHIQESIDHKGRIRGLTTGLHDLDRTMWGVDDQEGEIFVIAARPGQGKTALMCSILEHLGRCGVPTAVDSLEMSLNQIGDRVFLGGAGIANEKAQTGMFSKAETVLIKDRVVEISGMPLYFYGGSEINSAELRTQLQTLKRKHGIRAVIFDRLELIDAVTKEGKENERVKLVEAMRALQWCKKQLKLGIYVLVQMARDADKKNAGALPVLADLQGSSAIEQFADHIGFILRPSYYKPWDKLGEKEREFWINGHDAARFANPDCWSDGSEYPDDEHGYARMDYEEHALLCLRKNRRGPTPNVPMRYEGKFTRFTSRTSKLFSNNAAERQTPATPPAPTKPPARPAPPREVPDEPPMQQPSFDSASFAEPDDREDYDR